MIRYLFVKTGYSYEHRNDISTNIMVYPDDIYDPCEKIDRAGYGFLTPQIIDGSAAAVIPEINSGFLPYEWYVPDPDTLPVRDCAGVGLKEETGRHIPLTFAADVSENGNYLIQIEFSSVKDVKNAMIFAGRRNLVWIGDMTKGKKYTVKCIENVSSIIPRYHTEPVEDQSIDITFIGEGIRIASLTIDKWNGPAMYIAGDSTVTDQCGYYPYYADRCYAGWGQMLPYFLNGRYAVSNHSHSGLTSESFREDGHYKLILGMIKKGDVFLMQFGHNDQKIDHLSASTGYKNNIVRYIKEIRNLGAEPVLVTPIARNSWKGKEAVYNDLLREYADQCIKIGREEGIRIIDLHGWSVDLIKKAGRDGVKKFYYPSDYTHTNDYGAYMSAAYIGKKLIRDDAGHEDAEMKDKCEGKWFSWEAPDDLSVLPSDNDTPKEVMTREELLQGITSLESDLKRWEAYSMIEKRMKFFPCNVYCDHFEDIIGNEIFAGTVECAIQNGIIPDAAMNSKKFAPYENINGREFMEILELAYNSRCSYGVPLTEEERDRILNRECISGNEAADILSQVLI